MKIFATGFSDLSGIKSTPGGMVHLLEVCRNLQGLGNELILFVSSPKPYQGDLPFKVVYLPYIPIRFLTSVFQPFFLFIYLIAYRFKYKCDVVYENTVMYSCGGVFAAKLMRAKHCMTVHGFYTDEMEMGGHGKLRVLVVKIWEKINYMLTDALFCVTPVVRDKIEALYKIRKGVAHFVYNGVDAERCKPIPKQEAAEKLDMDPKPFYVGFTGYLYPWSGIDKLIEAAPKVLKECPDTRFLIVGHGLWGDKLPEIAKEKGVLNNFDFVGYQPWEKIPLYSALYDIGTTPYPPQHGVGSYRSSMKSLEYSSAGTPVVITRCKGVSDIIEDGNCGLIVAPESNEELADAIVKLLKDSKLRKKLGENGRKLVLKKYTWKHVAQNMLDIINKNSL